MTISDGVLAYRVLNSANLNEEEMKLCRATLNEFSYDEMVKQLIKIYGDSVSLSFGKEAKVKEEPVFYGSFYFRGSYAKSNVYNRQNFKSRGRGRASGRGRGDNSRNQESSRSIY